MFTTLMVMGDGDVDVDDERLVRLGSHLELVLRVSELVLLHHLGHSMIVDQLVVLRKDKNDKQSPTLHRTSPEHLLRHRLRLIESGTGVMVMVSTMMTMVFHRWANRISTELALSIRVTLKLIGISKIAASKRCLLIVGSRRRGSESTSCGVGYTESVTVLDFI